MLRSAALTLVSIPFLLLGTSCERKAPNIEQCQFIARQVLGIRGEDALESAKVRERYDQVSFDCLTRPFDQELYGCLKRPTDAQLCLIEYRQRAAAIQEEPSE